MISETTAQFTQALNDLTAKLTQANDTATIPKERRTGEATTPRNSRTRNEEKSTWQGDLISRKESKAKEDALLKERLDTMERKYSLQTMISSTFHRISMAIINSMRG